MSTLRRRLSYTKPASRIQFSLIVRKEYVNAMPKDKVATKPFVMVIPQAKT